MNHPQEMQFISAPDPFLDSTESRGVIWIHDHVRHSNVQRASHLRNSAAIEGPAITHRTQNDPKISMNVRSAFFDFPKIAKLPAEKSQSSRRKILSVTSMTPSHKT